MKKRPGINAWESDRTIVRFPGPAVEGVDERFRSEQSAAQCHMLDPEDVASAVLLACTQSAKSRIIEIQMRTMAESFA